MLMYRAEIVLEVQQHWKMGTLPRQLLPIIAGIDFDTNVFTDQDHMRQYVIKSAKEASLAVAAYVAYRKGAWKVELHAISYADSREMISREWKQPQRHESDDRKIVKGRKQHQRAFVKRWIPAYSGEPNDRIVVAALTICIWALRKIMYIMRKRSECTLRHFHLLGIYASEMDKRSPQRFAQARVALGMLKNLEAENQNRV